MISQPPRDTSDAPHPPGVSDARSSSGAPIASPGSPAPDSLEARRSSERATTGRTDTLIIPAALAAFFFLVNAFTATGFHTFDGISYIRDMGKPLAAMVLPHHLIYEPAILGFYNLWRALGWAGQADLPAQILSSLAGAGAVAIFYKLAWELSGRRSVALVCALALAFSYGFWFYSVEVEIYVPPLFFLLAAAWLLARVIGRGSPAPVWLAGLVGLSHAAAVLIHQGSLFIVPAFALGLLLSPGSLARRVGRALVYGIVLAGVVGPAYLIAGVVIAGQNTLATFVTWVNHYGSLGSWGSWRPDSLDATVSGASAAVSAEFWTGRVLLAALLLLVLARAVPITHRNGPLAAALWTWFGIYALFFAWWQPENLKFWVLMLPAPVLLGAMSFDWQNMRVPLGRAALPAGVLAVALLALTNAPAIWARRDPMSDPARQTSAALAAVSGPEDLIVLQAGSAEEYLPFYYNRINLISARELWYTQGGAGRSQSAVQAILGRAWHALAKGDSVWIEDRVLQPGRQISDHYVFTGAEVERLLSPYGERVWPESVVAGPEVFYRLSPLTAYSKHPDWDFRQNHDGWSGVNIAGERTGEDGWCFAPLEDPNLYGPPIQAQAASLTQVEILLSSTSAGRAQLFYRTDPLKPYSEAESVAFDVQPGEHFYRLPLGNAPGWAGTIRGLRLDPVETGDVTGGVENTVCVKGISLGGPQPKFAGEGQTR